MKKTKLAILVSAVFVLGQGAVILQAQAADPVEAKGTTQIYDANNTSSPASDPIKILGGWKFYKGETPVPHNDAHTNITVNGNIFDEIIGGDYAREANAGTSALASTTVKINGGGAAYVVGGTKNNQSLSVVNIDVGSIALTITDGEFYDHAKPTKGESRIVGGNYIKVPSGFNYESTATAGDISVTISGGTFGQDNQNNFQSITGGSFTENFNSTTSESNYSVTDTSSKLEMSGGKVIAKDAVVAGGTGAKGLNATAKTLDSTSVILNTDGKTQDNFSIAGRTVGGSFASGDATVNIGETSSVKVTGTGSIALNDAVIGGNLWLDAGASGTSGTLSSNVKTSSVTIDTDATLGDEVIGGSYIRGSEADASVTSYAGVNRTAAVGSSEVVFNKGNLVGNIIGGGKTNLKTDASMSSNVEGTSSIVMTGGTVGGMLIGGGSAKSNTYAGSSKADVQNTKVTVTGGEVNGVVGGGNAYFYSGQEFTNTGDGVSASVSGTTEITISGTDTVVNALKYCSGPSDCKQPSLKAAVVAGGFANNIADSSSSPIKAETHQTNISITDGAQIKDDIYGGGYANGAETESAVDSSTVYVSDIDGSASAVKVFAGGYASNTATSSTVADSSLTVVNSQLADISTGGTGDKASVSTAKIALEDVTLSGTLNLSAAEKVTQATFSGENTVKNVTLQDKDGKNVVENLVFDGNSTKEGSSILTVQDGGIDLSKANTTTITNAKAGTEIIKTENGGTVTATGANIQLETAFGTTKVQLGDAASGDSLAITSEGLKIGDETYTGTTTTNGNAKVLAESFLGSMAFVNQGAEFIADEGLAAMESAVKTPGVATFGTIRGGSTRYQTGSHVTVDGVSLAAGAAGRITSRTQSAMLQISPT